MATKYRVEVRGEFGGATGGWRPAIIGTLNGTGKSDEYASTVDGESNAQELRRLVLDASRNAEAWWAWHDADYSHVSPGENPDEATADAERRCAEWLAGESDDGPAACDVRIVPVES